MWTSVDFPEMVQHADAVVRVRVKSVVTEVGEFKYSVAELAVEKIVVGQCEKEIRLGFDEYALEDKSNGYAAGDTCYLCLFQDSRHPGLYREMNYGFSKMPLKDGKVQVPVKFLPDGLKERLNDCPPEELEGWLTWLRGPAIAIKPAKKTFRCDEPIVAEVTLSNTSPRPMELTLGTVEGFSAHCDATLMDANGFEVLSQATYGGRPDYQTESFPADKTSGKRTLKPGESFTGTARFHPRLDEFVENPEQAMTLIVAYSPRVGNYGWATDAWHGNVKAKAAVAIDCPFGAWADGLLQPGKSWRTGLDAKSLTTVPKQGMTVEVWLERPSIDYDFTSGGGTSELTLTPEDEKALAACFTIGRQDKALPGPPAAADRASAWLALLDVQSKSFSFTIDLARHFTFDTAGIYSVRFALPGQGAVSNRLTFTIPEETKK